MLNRRPTTLLFGMSLLKSRKALAKATPPPTRTAYEPYRHGHDLFLLLIKLAGGTGNQAAIFVAAVPTRLLA
jgi:hypothetical protein